MLGFAWPRGETNRQSQAKAGGKQWRMSTTNFVLIQSRVLFGLLETFFDRPTATGDVNQLLPFGSSRAFALTT